MTHSDARTESPPALRFVILLVAVVAILAGVRFLITPDLEVRNLEFFPDMSTSPALESQSFAPGSAEGVPVFADGLGQQPLVAGVVPRGTLPFRYEKTDEEAQRAGRELTNPFAKDDAAALTRGAEVYRIHCVPCHDATGAGLGAAVMRGMQQPPPFKGANAMQMEDGRMFHLLTLGRGNMPPLQGRIDADDRWRAVLHVRALQAGPAEPAAPEESTDPKEEDE
jgi:mono/diheme cytochrome c family protein